MLPDVYSQETETEIHTTGVDGMGKKTRKVTGLRLKGDVYYIDTTIKGHRLTERVGAVSLRMAEAVLAKRKTEIYEGLYFPKKKEPSPLVREVCTEYVDKKLSHVKSCSTRIHLFKPIDRLLGKTVAKDLRISDVEEYRRVRLREPGRMSGRPVSISTVNHEVKELLMSFQWAVKERVLEYNPIAGIEHLREPAPKKIMLDHGAEEGDDWRRLYNALGEKDRYTNKLTIRGHKTRLKFLIQYRTGMRIGEINQLRHSWIDQIKMVIHLPDCATKSGTARDIPIDMELVQAIGDYRALCGDPKYARYASDKYLFINPVTGEPDKSSKNAFRLALDRAGMDGRGITSHALRRTRGTIWDGIDERASMEALGHSDHKVHRKHYTEVTEDRMRKLVDGEPDSADNSASKAV